MKIRQVMCNLNESIQQNQLLSNDEDLNLQNIDDRNLDENNCSGDNKFMTEYEISKKMKIKEEFHPEMWYNLITTKNHAKQIRRNSSWLIIQQIQAL